MARFRLNVNFLGKNKRHKQAGKLGAFGSKRRMKQARNLEISGVIGALQMSLIFVGFG